MATEDHTFDQWLKNAKVHRHALSQQQLAVLQAAFGFLRSCGSDYYSLRMLSHFLLNCDAGLKVAQVARLVHVSRQTASRQQKLSSKEVVQSAHNRVAGRPYGKLLPRYAGPIAQFLVSHPDASRGEIIDFIQRTWNVRVSSVALYHFMKKYGSLGRGLLSSVFALVIGMPRVFHLDQMQDLGFAFLSGGWRCPSRHLVGAWRRHLTCYEVDSFCRRTSPWDGISGQQATVSFDEHSIPRWTHKFSIRKGYVTTRNKYMRCEKLYYGYDVVHDRYLTVRGTPGSVELRDVSLPMTRQVLTQGRPRRLHALFDAGAGKSDADVRALLNLANETPNLDVTLRACRYPHRVRVWKDLPAEEFVSYEEPGVCVTAPPKEIRLAETSTVLKDEDPSQGVRTIVCRQVMPGPKKDRWHPLYTTSNAQPPEVLDTFRTRQHHEQGYRVGVYDEFLNAVPCGYDKQSPNRQRPRFHRGPLQMIGWLVALVYNAIADLANHLPAYYHGMHVSTLRRTFFNRPGQLYCTPNTLIVYLDSFSEQEALIPLIDQINQKQYRVPWLDDRRLVLSLTPSNLPRPGP